MKKAKLILGGGSAFGLAHIGVIKALTAQYEITGVVGTSMGAIVGGCFACSISPAEMLEMALDVSTIEIFNPLTLDFSRRGVFDGKAIYRLFEEWTKKRMIEDTDIPYIAVAYDLHRQITILIDKGPCAAAMRASSSLPFVFAPQEMGDYLMIDGSVAHPVPLAFADKVPGEITIAVNVLPLASADAEFYKPNTKKGKDKLNRYEVLLNSLMQNQSFMAIQSIVNNKPDIIINANHPDLGFYDLKKAEEFYDFGYKAAKKAMGEYSEPDFAAKLRGNYEKLLERIVNRH
ncbi:MAG: patatin-like phospholipase family protein [Candidatus Cloacimonetes bacterium]|jgi:NTE family protein|nr:patatin-like phospholipase family protein [Candidatus Cloacimonadota bacterium]MDD2423865.1 patatin-like phospholipase family protein [Candidatus Cloacimonadota bacterium]MDD3563865.1 patatin-like phospholipase family protein [Candidatus Cloacimonadota bacterium]MDD4277028.1 patatin-like phospholipase family protein [Candidatus Cloacimonadota bacterium]MDY0325007.1 patatin-like phospholipase family protein [Candidatus Cloacimonadaceae bacterium]